MNERARTAVLFGLLSVAYVLAFLALRDHALIFDENPHFYYIRDYAPGKMLGGYTPYVFSIHMYLVTYHSVMWAFSHFFMHFLPRDYRFYTMVMGVSSVLVFRATARRIEADGESAFFRTLEYALFPIMLPYFFLVYTDVPSMLFVLSTLYLALGRRYFLSALVGLASLFVRMNNVVWCGFFFLLIYFREHGWTFRPGAILRHAARGWLYLLTLAGFVAFIVWNGGVVVRDREMHPIAVHVGNVYAGLFAFFFMFLPMHVANLPQILALAKRRKKWLLFGLPALFAVYMALFTNDHPYNEPARWYFFRNALLTYLLANPLRKALFFLPMAGGLLALAATRLKEPAFYLLYPVTAFLMLFTWLIEPRYYFVPMVFFMLFRERQRAETEWVTVAYYLVLSAVVVYKISHHVFFL